MNPSDDGANPVYASLDFSDIENAAARRAAFEGIAQRVFGVVVLPLHANDETSWTATRAALEMCADFNVKAWLRIEYSIPQTANAETANAETANAETAKFEGAPYVTYRMWDVAAGYEPQESDSPLALTIVPRSALGELDWARARTRTGRAQSPNRLEFDARIYGWREQHDATRAFDPLDSRAVENVISSTRNAWKSVISPTSREVVQGVSVSVPPLWDENAPDAMRRFPWSLELPIRFGSLHGGDLAEQLSSLVADTGSDAVRVRQEFWQTVATLLRENFAERWENWARENGVPLQWRFSAANLNRLVARATAPLRRSRAARPMSRWKSKMSKPKTPRMTLTQKARIMLRTRFWCACWRR